MIIYLQTHINAFAGNFYEYTPQITRTISVPAAPTEITALDDVRIIFGGIDAMAIRWNEMKLGGI